MITDVLNATKVTYKVYNRNVSSRIMMRVWTNVIKMTDKMV